MKKMLLFLLPLLCGITLAATQPVVSVKPQQKEVLIHLPANPTTGYQWTVKSYDKKVLKLIKQQYRSKSKLIGSGGETTFYFQCMPKIKRPAETSVHLIYARSWEKGSGQETVVKLVFLKE